jgi:hypothetical protein
MTTTFNCILCGSFIVASSKPRKDINAEIFNHFFDMHSEDVVMKAEDTFKQFLKMEED